MSRSHGRISPSGTILAGLLVMAANPSVAAADGPSSCITCHLDESMLLRNLGASTAKRSSLQSGAG
ncbi:MAG: hypothetical protein WCS72_02400 [Deltaproteobacteria bacterium]